MEARQLFAAPHGVILTIAPHPTPATAATAAPVQVGEYHGVLSFKSFPSGVIPGIGGSTSKPAPFQTPVILTIASAKKNGRVTGTLNAHQLGTFSVTGTINDDQVSLKLTPSGKSGTGASAAGTTAATFRGTITKPGHLTGTFLENINGQDLSGRLRLNFIKQTPAQTPGAGTATGAISTGSGTTGALIVGTTGNRDTGLGTGSTNTGAVDTTVNPGLGGVPFGSTDISGTTTGFRDTGITPGAGLDVSGTNIGVGTGIRQTIGVDINAPVFGGALTPDISGTRPTPLLGSGGTLDISGTNTGVGVGGILPSMVP